MTGGQKILHYIKYCGHSQVTELIEYNNSHYIFDPRYRGQDGYRYICPVNGNVLITSDFNDCHFSFPDEFVENNPYIRIKDMGDGISGKGMNEATYIASLMNSHIYRVHPDPNCRLSWELERIINEEDLTANYFWKWKIYNDTMKNYE